MSGKKIDTWELLSVCANLAAVLAVIVCALILGQRYPLMREFLIVYVIAEVLHPCLSAILHIGRGDKEAKNCIRSCFTDWFCGRKLKKLWITRAFSGFVLLLMLIKQPDFFKANIMMLIGMIIMIVLLIMQAVDEWRLRAQQRTQNTAGENTLKKHKKGSVKIVIGAAAILLYLLLGVLLSGFPQPELSDEYKESFHAEDYYGDGNGTDRAAILEDNSEALIERVRMIRNAKERIVLSTFDFRTDISGKVLLAALLDAADRNVQVQVVVDGVSGLMRMEQNPYFFALSSHPNAEIRIYNKVNPLFPWKLMGRLHDKYLIADDTAYILGGRNSFSYFLGEWPGHKNYDRDVLVYNAGKSASSSLYQVEAYFNEIWNLKYTSVFHNSNSTAERTCVKNAAEELRDVYAGYLADYPEAAAAPDYAAMTYPTNKITLLANPTTIYAKEPTAFYALTELMKQAKQSVTIHTPYIIANDLMYDAFAEIAASVPETAMMTNSVANNGNPFGAGDYRANFEKILATGIQLLEYEGGVSYHGKSIVIDDDLSIVGSFNMDMRSVYLDTELMLVIDSEEVNAQLRGLLSRYEDECAIVQPDGTRVYPEGVIPQEVTRKKHVNMALLYNLLRWARRLL